MISVMRPYWVLTVVCPQAWVGALHDVSWKVDIDMDSPIQSVPRGEGRFPCYVALQFCSPHVAMIFSKSRVMEQLRESEPQGLATNAHTIEHVVQRTGLFQL